MEFSEEGNIKTIDINDLGDKLSSIKLIDIREPSEVKLGRLKEAENIPMAELLNNPESYLNKEDEYYLMCRSGIRSASACAMLSDLGYKVINVGGGISAYRGK